MGNTNVIPMNPSVKKWVKWMRIVLLATRVLEFIAACGLLTMMIILNKVDDVSGWIMRIVVSAFNHVNVLVVDSV